MQVEVLSSNSILSKNYNSSKKKTLMWTRYFRLVIEYNLIQNTQNRGKKPEKRMSLEPDSNQWPKDICTITLQSSALPSEFVGN